MRHVVTYGHRLIAVVVFVAGGLMLAACGPAVINPTPITQAQAMTVEAERRGYQLGPGDNLDIRFFYTPELDVAVTVRPDGRISLPLVDEMQVAGRTVGEVTEELRRRYAEELRRPEVSVIVKSFASHRYFVGGEVQAPTSIDSATPVTVLQAVTSAGGLKATARTGEVAIIRQLAGRDPIVIAVDLAAALDGTDTAQDIVLRPKDVVFVPRSDIGEVNRIIDLYVRQNIPISVGLGIPVGSL